MSGTVGITQNTDRNGRYVAMRPHLYHSIWRAVSTTNGQNQMAGISAVGSAGGLGPSGREFESPISDHVGASCISLAPTFSKVRARSLRCSSFPNRTRFAGLRFGFGRNLERKSILTPYSTPEQSRLCSGGFLQKSPSALFSCSAPPNQTRCAFNQSQLVRKIEKIVNRQIWGNPANHRLERKP